MRDHTTHDCYGETDPSQRALAHHDSGRAISLSYEYALDPVAARAQGEQRDQQVRSSRDLSAWRLPMLECACRLPMLECACTFSVWTISSPRRFFVANFLLN